MKSASPVIEVPATPEYVLTVFQEQHRLYFLIDYDMLPREELTFETTVEEWREEMDLVS